MGISERIYQYMEEKGISQKEFVRQTGISQSTVSDWRRKGTNPTAEKLMVICEVLGITPYELLTGNAPAESGAVSEEDCMILNKNSREYRLVETYRSLNPDARKKLEGYLRALQDFL